MSSARAVLALYLPYTEQWILIDVLIDHSSGRLVLWKLVYQRPFLLHHRLFLRIKYFIKILSSVVLPSLTRQPESERVLVAWTGSYPLKAATKIDSGMTSHLQ